MKLTESTITTLTYTSERSGETTTRVILPTSVPADVVRAIDLDTLSPSEREELRDLHEEYTQYVELKMKQILNFENWVDISKQKQIAPKWRAFKVSGIK